MAVSVEHPTSALRRRWRLTAPVRWALRELPLPRGRHRLGQLMSRSLYPSDQRFVVRLSPDCEIPFGYREAVAQGFLYFGEFEATEARALAHSASEGLLIDVGANVGYMTAFAATRRPGLQVVAIEPIPENLERLRSATRALPNVRVIPKAVGEQAGELVMSSEGAYASVSTEGDVRVPVVTLDSVWEDLGRPRVQMVKIDVEGFEPQVLRGAMALLRDQRPQLIIEAWGTAALEALDVELAPLGYRATQPRGFERWNHLYIAGDEPLEGCV